MSSSLLATTLERGAEADVFDADPDGADLPGMIVWEPLWEDAPEFVFDFLLAGANSFSLSDAMLDKVLPLGSLDENRAQVGMMSDVA